MTQCYINSVGPQTACSCDDCDWEGIGENLEMITDIEERIDPGCVVPAGECPECGALAYVSQPERWTAQAKADAIAKIHKLLDGTEWNSDTTSAIAKIITDLGLKVAEPA